MEVSEVEATRRTRRTADGVEEEEDNETYTLHFNAETKEGIYYKAMGIATLKYCVLIMKPSSSESFAKNLYEELECPVCLEYMMPPITMCVSGHNVCGQCKDKLRHCSICRGEFTDIRCFSLENLIRKTSNACKYKRHGCDRVMTLEELSRHQPECEFRKLKCPFSILGTCDWKGADSEIKPHIVEKHTEMDAEERDVQGMIYSCCSNMREDGNWNQVLFTLDGVFMVHTRTKDGMLYVLVLHVGDRSRARDYKYQCTFETRDRSRTVTFSEVTQSYTRDLTDIMQTEECTVLRYSFVKKCVLHNGSLRFKTTISEASLPGVL